ncbi:DUF86 domain-containing protein [cf. Phormidesmis sp. LEGE 11477]|uniref:HepT-like ribonuclease domain-containing protein n=1 Tax=cf. Phormidesmis sp. LEGE 11477 TaxID=1828680 RepID=UPI001881C987|nr:HepT-like ribonuclease domain-containing protein [cf. Phormidesmis sp. LEGE 11477]MBE9061204.1 DUF86 domain-containing protein [cf. Phormidesmis sp. LEGE 11477]
MYAKSELIDRLKRILEATELIPERFQSISKPEDFLTTSTGKEHLDSICMVLLAVGESFKQIDQRTEGKLLSNYPDIPWRDIMALRNILAHVYFEIDEEEIYSVCEADIKPLLDTIRRMIKDLERNRFAEWLL